MLTWRIAKVQKKEKKNNSSFVVTAEECVCWCVCVGGTTIYWHLPLIQHTCGTSLWQKKATHCHFYFMSPVWLPIKFIAKKLNSISAMCQSSAAFKWKIMCSRPQAKPPQLPSTLLPYYSLLHQPQLATLSV